MRGDTTAAVVATGSVAILSYIASRNADPPNKMRVVLACIACAVVVYGVVYTVLLRSNTGAEVLERVQGMRSTLGGAIARQKKTTMEKAQHAAAARQRALENTISQVSGDEKVAQGEQDAYMDLLGRVSGSISQEMSEDPGFNRAAAHIEAQLKGDKSLALAQSQSQLHGMRDLVPSAKPTTVTDASFVRHTAQTLTGEEMGAQTESVMRATGTGGILAPGVKSEQQKNMQLVSEPNAGAIRKEGEETGILAPDTHDELSTYWASTDIATATGPAADNSEALLQQAIDNAGR